MKLICTGDSIVDGFPYGRDTSFPSVIKKMTGWDVLNRGISGQSSGEIAARFGYDIGGADSVLILCGANDYIFDICGVGETMENIRSMILLASKQNIKAAVCSPPLCSPEQASRSWADCGVSAYERINSQLEELRSMIKDLCSPSGSAEFIDVQKFYSKYAEYHDGVHPTIEGYRLIGEEIASSLTA